MKSFRVLLALICVLCLLLCSCGKAPASPTPTAAPGKTPTDAPTTAPSAVPVIAPTDEPTAAPTAVPTPTTAPDQPLALNQSSQFNVTLAEQLLTVCTGGTAPATKTLFEKNGFSVLLQKNFDKAMMDPSHTCAYTVGKRDMTVDGKNRVVYLIAVRGTNEGEWFSNFDFAPSHDANTQYAENFYRCAEDVLAGLQSVLTDERPVLAVCGHSRGAACANLLGTVLDQAYPADDVFVYTFATPTTVRGDAAKAQYDNIFNVINPCDAVPMVPLAQWGYVRAGRDILLPADETKAKKVADAVNSLYDMAPDIDTYYHYRHSLTKAGSDTLGMTAFEMMTLLCGSLVVLGSSVTIENPAAQFSWVPPESDFSPLLALVNKAMANNGYLAQAVLTEHMPQTYLLGLHQYTAQQ